MEQNFYRLDAQSTAYKSTGWHLVININKNIHITPSWVRPRWVTITVCHLGIQPSQLSLAIPPWVGTMSTS